MGVRTLLQLEAGWLASADWSNCARAHARAHARPTPPHAPAALIHRSRHQQLALPVPSLGLARLGAHVPPCTAPSLPLPAAPHVHSGLRGCKVLRCGAVNDLSTWGAVLRCGAISGLSAGVPAGDAALCSSTRCACPSPAALAPWPLAPGAASRVQSPRCPAVAPCPLGRARWTAARSARRACVCARGRFASFVPITKAYTICRQQQQQQHLPTASRSRQRFCDH